MTISRFVRTKFIDSRGCLESLEFDERLPFSPKRIYFLSDVPAGENRGLHAHKQLHQIIICLQGSVDLKTTDSVTSHQTRMSASSDGLYIQPGIWRELSNFKEKTVLMVLASHHFDENDYIYDYEEFITWKESQ
jgi:dTDP-4-dehydrorhamnose 3,5-epimerase-like enzyme